jgi:hypothetical protein
MGAMSPSSKRSIFGGVPRHRFQLALEVSRSLWRQMRLGPPQCRMPSIIEAWFLASEKTVASPNSLTRVDSAPPDVIDGFVHGAQHLGVLAHAEIVVGAPHRDIADRAVG